MLGVASAGGPGSAQPGQDKTKDLDDLNPVLPQGLIYVS